MLRSMYSGISGMKANQTKLDVIGNNISNSGTTSFKSSRVTFSDIMNQNISDAMAPSLNEGGKNSSQIGLGVQLSSIDRVMTQGMMQPTGRLLDCAVDGDGFFVVSKGPKVFGNEVKVNHSPGIHTVGETDNGSELLYTRDGSFTIDKEGNLLTKDGYRIMGYSVSNDDTSVEATGKAPNKISNSGLDFQFTPGTQLNGYKIILGEVGPNTVTSAQLNKEDKNIILNGDFSGKDSITNEQITNAINKTLNAEGISQQVTVNGTHIVLNELSTNKVAGGADAVSPENLSFLGYTVSFDEGNELNGYTFQIGEVGIGIETKAEVKGNVISIDADLASGNLNRETLQVIINKALKEEGIFQEVKLTGSGKKISTINSESLEHGTNAKKPTITPNEEKAGLTFDFGIGEGLNGYEIIVGEPVEGEQNNVTLDSTKKRVTISLGYPKKEPKEKVINSEDIIKKFNKELNINGKTGPKLKGITIDKNFTGETFNVSEGKDYKAPSDIELGGIKLGLPKGPAFNDLKIEITNLRNQELGVQFDKDEKIIKLSGDFITPGAISGFEVADKINDNSEIKDYIEKYINENKDLFKSNESGNDKIDKDKTDEGNDGKLKEDAGDLSKDEFDINEFDINEFVKEFQFVGSGFYKGINGLTSDPIEGGEQLVASDTELKVNGLNLALTPGGSLNGYTFRLGTISEGTRISSDIDKDNKVITINGDFTSPGVIDNELIRSALNKSLDKVGITQRIKSVTGDSIVRDGTKSGEATGGTPIKSLKEDGSMVFVNGSGNIKAYDGELKTLRIPEKVTMPGSDTPLVVKSFSIDKAGLLTGILEDGRIAALGQLAMAAFKNPEGLNNMGKNLYTGSANSGSPIIRTGVGTLGEDNSSGYGDSVQGMLEMSNVDLAEQFTDMIVTTRAFQASGKMINTGDEILQDIINLKR